MRPRLHCAKECAGKVKARARARARARAEGQRATYVPPLAGSRQTRPGSHQRPSHRRNPWRWGGNSAPQHTTGEIRDLGAGPTDRRRQRQKHTTSAHAEGGATRVRWEEGNKKRSPQLTNSGLATETKNPAKMHQQRDPSPMRSTEGNPGAGGQQREYNGRARGRQRDERAQRGG